MSSPGITLLRRQVRDGTEYKSCFTAGLPFQVVFQSFPSMFSAPLLKSNQSQLGATRTLPCRSLGEQGWAQVWWGGHPRGR